MKKLLLAATAFVFSLTVMAQQKADEVIKVNTEKHDFGKIKKDVPVTTFFEIKNTSDKTIVVENAWGSCGCTTPEIPKEPIAPNATAKLKVQYNAASIGGFTKDVFIKLAGVQEPKNIKITGEVLDATAYEAYAKENAKAKAAAAAKKSKPGR
jgi:hypothetical protein